MLAGIASLARISNPILKLLTTKRDLKNIKDFVKAGSKAGSWRQQSESGEKLKDIILPTTKGPLLRGESMKRNPDLISTGITGEGQPGGYYTTDIMKALDYAENAPTRIEKIKTIERMNIANQRIRSTFKDYTANTPIHKRLNIQELL